MSKASQHKIQIVLAKMQESLKAAWPNFRDGETRFKMSARVVELELKAEEVRQRELANMIAMASNPTACPYTAPVVLDRIKELSNLD